MKPETWRSSIVGILILAFVGFRVYVKPESLFEPETVAMCGAAFSLILGSDKLLGR